MPVMHLVLDGSSVALDGPVGLTVPPTNFTRWSIDGRIEDFGTGHRGYAAAAVSSLGTVIFVEEYAFQGGRLRIGTDVLVDRVTLVSTERRWAVWEGLNYSMYAGRAGVHSADLMALLDRFLFEEESAGLTLLPKDSQTTQPVRAGTYPHVYKTLPEIGLLTIYQLTNEHLRSLPSWQGQRVQGGELFRLEPTTLDDGQTQERLALVGATTFTVVDVDLQASDAEMLDSLSQISVEWKE